MNDHRNHASDGQTRPPKKPALERPAAALAVVATLMLVVFAPPAAAAEEGPVIDAIRPGTGPAGTEVTLAGEGFSQDLNLYFGGHPVTYEIVSAEEIVFDAPALEPNKYLIELEDPDDSDRSFRSCCFTLTEGEAEDASADADEEETETQSTSSSQTTSSDDCREREMNIECNAFGRIAMESQRDIRGDTIRVSTEIWLNTNLQDQGGRYIMFSIRNVTQDGGSPISVDLVKFATPHGDVITNQVDHESPNVLDLWVHVIDVPVEEPITLEVDVGSTERGAYRLETLVLGFDRGYEPIKGPDGEDASLFSFTLLGVNEESGSVSEGTGSTRIGALPGFGASAALVATVALAGILARKRRGGA